MSAPPAHGPPEGPAAHVRRSGRASVCSSLHQPSWKLFVADRGGSPLTLVTIDAARSRILTLVFWDTVFSTVKALSCGQRSVAMITPSAWSMTVLETIDDRNWSLVSLHDAIRSASVSAPDACPANCSARAVSAGPNARGRRAYRVSAPAGSASANSGTARHARRPSATAC